MAASLPHSRTGSGRAPSCRPQFPQAVLFCRAFREGFLAWLVAVFLFSEPAFGVRPRGRSHGCHSSVTVPGHGASSSGQWVSLPSPRCWGVSESRHRPGNSMLNLEALERGFADSVLAAKSVSGPVSLRFQGATRGGRAHGSRTQVGCCRGQPRPRGP